MLNVAYKTVGSKLVIEIDLSKQAQNNARPSSTGKTMLLATTAGKTMLPLVDGRECSFALNVMLKP